MNGAPRRTTLLEAIDSEVRDECARLVRIAATGLYRRTSACLRLHDKAQDHRTTHRTSENEKRLAGMHRRISKIGTQLTSSRGSFLKDRADGIDRRLAAERATQREIGVLERIRALGELASGNAVLFAGIWPSACCSCCSTCSRSW
ncbi:hypothetical protein [Streptomyces sp. NPDC058735]|uniref:hypothetical protein n=1 Tax=unclassified Streptomyces TaxID=2593676 RepID=UPI0036C516B7